MCEEPRGRGTGICIEAFIRKTFVGVLPVGDGRGFSSSGGSYKASIRFSIDPSTGSISDLEKSIGSTLGLRGSGNLSVGKAVSDGQGGYSIAVQGSVRSKVNVGGNIDFLFDVHVDADGNANVEVAGHSEFPSFEVFQYRNGQADQIYGRYETGNPFTSLFGEYDVVTAP